MCQGDAGPEGFSFPAPCFIFYKELWYIVKRVYCFMFCAMLALLVFPDAALAWAPEETVNNLHGLLQPTIVLIAMICSIVLLFRRQFGTIFLVFLAACFLLLVSGEPEIMGEIGDGMKELLGLGDGADW